MTHSDALLPETSGQEGPIFVISLERSGSTLLRNVLDAHPAIFSPAQLNIGKLCHWTYWAAYYSIAQVDTELTEEERRKQAVAATRRYVDGLMGGFAGQKGKRIWCDKSTMNINNLEIIQQVFPDARFVCLYRHCMDLVYSYLSVSKLGFMEEVASYVQKNPLNFVSAVAQSWIDRTGTILNFEKNSRANCYRVTYESLVGNNSETLRGLFGFLGLELDGQLLNRVFSNKGKGPVEGDIKFQFSSKISTDSVGQGADIPLTYLPKPQMDRINELLAALGYPPIGMAADTAPAEAGAPVRELFYGYFPNLLKQRLDNFRALNCTCKIQVSGEGGGVWTFDLAKPGGEIREENGEAVCTIGLSGSVLRKIIAGEIAPLEAFEQGIVGASGDIRMAINFGKLLFEQAGAELPEPAEA